MYYETKVKFTEKASGETKKQGLIVDAELFGEAEMQSFYYAQGATDIDVEAIKRSAVKEFVNNLQDEDEQIYFARLSSETIDDKGKVKKVFYTVALFAHSFDEAKNITNQYLKQGMEDMTIEAIAVKKLEWYDGGDGGWKNVKKGE